MQDINGLLYECETCADLELCYKCHGSRKSFHPAHHAFKEVGMEFVQRDEEIRSSSRQSDANGGDEEEGDDGGAEDEQEDGSEESEEGEQSDESDSDE